MALCTEWCLAGLRGGQAHLPDLETPDVFDCFQDEAVPAGLQTQISSRSEVGLPPPYGSYYLVQSCLTANTTRLFTYLDATAFAFFIPRYLRLSLCRNDRRLCVVIQPPRNMVCRNS